MKPGGSKNLILIASALTALLGCCSCGTDGAVPVYDESALDSLNEQNEAAIKEAEDGAEEWLSDDMPYGVGVFSWDHLPLVSDIECMKDNCVTELYQYISPEYTDEEIKDFLEDMASIGVDVYILDGEPEWSYEENYGNMENVLLKVKSLNEELAEDEAIKGIVYDVEPYVLDKWHNIPKQLLEEYASNLRKIRESAFDSEISLEILVCIPYSYDLMGHDKMLRSIIRESDGIMVMNYNKGGEIDNITREAALARYYEKRLVNVYELQPGLLSQTNNSITYYNDGIEAVEENYRELLDAYPNHNISIAYHTLDYLKVLSLEK